MADSADYRLQFWRENPEAYPVTLKIKEKTMTKNTVSIALDPESLARLLGNHSLAVGAHCGDDDGVDGVCGTVALGAHCGDDDGVDG
jgi:hypothetical protein